MAEEELGIRSKREPPKLTTPYITKTDSYTPGFLYRSIYTVDSRVLLFRIVLPDGLSP